MATIDTGHVLQGKADGPGRQGQRLNAIGHPPEKPDRATSVTADMLARFAEDGGTRPLVSGVSGDPIAMQMETEDLEFGGEIDRPDLDLVGRGEHGRGEAHDRRDTCGHQGISGALGGFGRG